MTNREFFINLCASEYPRFVAVLKAAQAGQIDYRPHPRSRSAYELIGHLIGHESDLVQLLQTGTIEHQIQVPFNGVDDALRIYADARATVTSALGALSEADWESMGKFLVGGNVIMEAPRRDLAWMILLDAVHHRGQLSTYLRPMGTTVPSIYGPSADTMVAHA